MKIGVVYPQNELGGDPEAVRRFARTVEDLGYVHLLAYDHVVGVEHSDRSRPFTGSYTEADPFHDPLVMFAHLAATTTRLQFATGVLVLPQRQTALVARQATDVDLFSGGRLRLGVGVGWNHVEYEALGQDFRTRGARQEEQIEVLRTLFTEPLVDYTGRFHRIDRAALLPRPTKPIPIWLGGRGDIAYDRAARLADGFIFIAGSAAEAIDARTAAQQRLAIHGRDTDGFGTEYLARPAARRRTTGRGSRRMAWRRRQPPLGSHHRPGTEFPRCSPRLPRGGRSRAPPVNRVPRRGSGQGWLAPLRGSGPPGITSDWITSDSILLLRKRRRPVPPSPRRTR